MRALVQRVARAEVQVEGGVVGRIGQGLLVYAAVGVGDTPVEAQWLAEKVANLRIFQDEQGKMNRSVKDIGGGILAISNFTLLADARKGRRPAFVAAAPADEARSIHEAFLDALDRQGVAVETGVFGASMKIDSEAAGPVNVVIDAPVGPPGESAPPAQ
jgi:D-tyrosyl-tRNA(Tyr) deacylase